MNPKLYHRAEQRIERSQELVKYASFILADWPEGDEHLKWVANATEQEILDWCAACEAEEDK